MLEISEIFYSLQGEGPFMGRPAVFVRLSGCVPPLCPWCDSLYACGPGEKMAEGSILDRITGFRNTGADGSPADENGLVVITGGEPFLQWDSGLRSLEERLVNTGFSVQYETSGKLQLPYDSGGYIVCSPKYTFGKWQFVSGNIDIADAFKFVVGDDFEETGRFIETHGIAAEKVWIMPLGATRDEQVRLMPSVWRFCTENRFNFSSRLHTLTFDSKRGI